MPQVVESPGGSILRNDNRDPSAFTIPAATGNESVNNDFTRQARLSWAKLIRRVYEIDPLLCPFCGAGMKILAFITDFATARAIRRRLKIPVQEPEPLAHGPPHEIELLDQIA